MSKEENYRWLKERAEKEGMVLFGVADFTRYDREHYLSPKEIEGLSYAISMGVRLSKAVLAGIEDGPTLLYSWHYRQANIQLDKTAFLIANLIQERGYRSLPIPASQIVDWRKQVAHLSHKHIARLAGLGWIGRNNLLVTPEYGAQVRLVTVLTDLPLPVADRVLPFGCGDCFSCISACPVSALGERAEDYSFERCFDKLTYFCKKKNLGLYICGICVKACPGRGVKD
ncbi:MAG: epoxyqueuosine reductase [Acidobacteria bacterium]|nr:epoxyqueuosine reductase [Acidobacteriota bacterium]